MLDSYFRIPPDSEGKRIRSLQETISSVDYYTQYVLQKKLSTFAANASAAALQTTNSQFAINNLTGSGFIIEVVKFNVENAKATGYAGAICRMVAGVATGAATGTASAIVARDSTIATPTTSQVAVVSSPSSKPTINNMIDFMYHTASIEQAAARSSDLLRQGNILSQWNTAEGIIVNANECFCVNPIDADATASLRFNAVIILRPA